MVVVVVVVGSPSYAERGYGGVGGIPPGGSSGSPKYPSVPRTGTIPGTLTVHNFKNCAEAGRQTRSVDICFKH